jgi:hypothetical protein
MAESYAMSLAKYKPEDVDAALTRHIESPESGFMPSVGRLIELIQLHKPPVNTYANPLSSDYCRICGNARWVLSHKDARGRTFVKRCQCRQAVTA